jgi:hypothetical protein
VEETGKDVAAGEQRIEPPETFAPRFRERRRGVDRAIGEGVNDCVEVKIGGLRRVPAVTAKAGQHLVDTVGGRGKPDLVEKDAGEFVLGEQLAKSPNRLSFDVRVVWAREAERLFHLAPLGPTAPAAAALATPVHDEVRLVHAFNVGKRAVPQLSVIDRPARTAELAEDFCRLSKPNNKQIEVDRVLHATHRL